MTKARKTKPHQPDIKASSSSHSNNESVEPTATKANPDSIVAEAGPSAERVDEETRIGSKGLDEASTSGSTPRKRNGDDASEASSAPPKKQRKKKKSNRDKPSSRSRSSPQTIRKLAPPRPFPTVPTSVSATGPRSAHTEGKNRICITRRSDLGMYLRRCKDVVMKDGYKTLHLHAMGAAIPHLARLAVSLPSILPYDPSVLQTEVLTGTTEVQDEIIPDDEDEDISIRTRGKSTMSVTIKIEGGDDEDTRSTTTKTGKGKGKGKGKAVTKQSDNTGETGGDKRQPKQLVYTESDMEDDGS